MRALSIRQPYAEQILRGTQRIEYRSWPTRIRERFYIDGATRLGPNHEFESLGLDPGDLPVGVIVGTVELVDCTKGRKGYEWHLRKPKQLARARRPKRHPQPAWFTPS